MVFVTFLPLKSLYLYYNISRIDKIIIMKDKEDLVVLGEYENTIEASMIKGVLETNGIQAMLTNEIMSNVLSLAPINYGMVRVLVFRSDLEQAKQVLTSAPVK